MAKLFKKSTFLFVLLGVLFLAEDHTTAANKHKEEKEIAAASAAGAASAASVIGATLKAGAGASGTVGGGLNGAIGIGAGASGSLGAGLKGVDVSIGGAADAAIGTGITASVDGAAGNATDVSVDSHGCACKDKVSEFLSKVHLILRYYTSKELGPELQALAVRFVDFFFTHLAAEKPEVMTKIHGFLQNSVQVTGAAVTKISKV